MSVTFSEYITKKYLVWRGDETRNTRSIAKYARDVLGISPQLLNEWMNRGKTPSDEKYIEILQRVYLDDLQDLYESLGRSIPLDSLPASVRAKLEAALLELNAAVVSKRISDPESPAGRKQISELLAKYGIDVTRIE